MKTAAQVYSELVRVPHSKWSGVIATLDPAIKQSLLTLLREKRAAEDASKNEKAAAPKSQPILTEAEASRPSKKRRLQSSMKSRFEKNESECQAPDDGVEGGDIPLKVITVCPLEKLPSMMYVAGDATDVSPDSERFMHQYLNLWMSALIFDLACTSIGKQNFTDPASINTFWSSKRKLPQKCLEYLQNKFPLEYQKYSREKMFQNSAHKKLSAESPSLEMNEILSDANDTTHKAAAAAAISCLISSTLGEHLFPVDRFLERLKARDIRTKELTTFEYNHFAKAREKTFRSCRPIIQDWVNLISATVSSTTDSPSSQTTVTKITINKRFFPATCLDFLLFLGADRLSSVVELAIKIRALEDDNNKWPDTSQSLLANAKNLKQLWETGFRFRPLSEVLHTKSLKDIISPYHYELAITLLQIYVDSPTFSISLNSIQLVDSKFRATHPSTNPQFLTGVSSSAPSNTTSQDSNVCSPTGLSNQTTPSNQTTMSQTTIEDLTHCAKTSPQSEEFFNQLITIAIKSFVPLQAPNKEAVFAYLFCRDIFWESRHKATHELWPSVLERLQQWEQDKEKSKLIENTFRKITSYAEAFHKIAAFQNFLLSADTNKIAS